MSFEERFNRAVDRIWGWIGWQAGLIQGRAQSESRSGFQPSVATGGFVLAAFVYQVVSGGLLLLYYEPSVYPTLTQCGQAAGSLSPSPAAWCSTYYILHSVPFGDVLLTSHLYGAYVLIFLMLVHLFRGLYVGSYKQTGRRFSWLAGTVLLLLTLGMGFTGYLLAYTQLSYNATQVSITLLQSLPVVGPSVASLFAGDGTPQSMLSRMFALHVVLLPIAIAVVVFLHKRTSWFPQLVRPLLKWGFLYVGVLLSVASLWVWQLPTYAGNPTGSQAATVPAWYFLWEFKLVDFVGVAPDTAMVVTAFLALLILLVPFLDRSLSPHPRDRPVFLFLANSLVGFFILLTAWGDLAPGVPVTAPEAALRLAPLLGVNAVAVAFFYRRYRRRVNEPALAQSPAQDRTTSPRVSSSTERSPARSAKSESLGMNPGLVWGVGLAGALFLLAFGLVVPFLFLLAAFLLHLPEGSRVPSAPAEARTPKGNGRWVFPVVATASVVALLIALFSSIML